MSVVFSHPLHQTENILLNQEPSIRGACSDIEPRHPEAEVEKAHAGRS